MQLFLVCIVVLSVLEIDLYLASFPAIGVDFLTSERILQRSLNIYLFVFSVVIFLYLFGLGIFLPQDKPAKSAPFLVNTSSSLLIFCQMLGTAFSGYLLNIFSGCLSLLYLIFFLTIVSASIFIYYDEEQKHFLRRNL